jgi:hypothetical protein
MDRIPVLDIEEVQALAEGLRFMVRFDAQPLSGVQPPETSLQDRYDVSSARRCL